MRSSSSITKKKIAFTLGDLGGVGPEIFEKFLKDNSSSAFEIVLIDEEFDYKNRLEKCPQGKASKLAGEHAFQVLEHANNLCMEKEFDYLITGPVAKESLWLADIQVSGQTELLAKLNGLSREDIEMFFVLENFRTVLATRHIPIKDVSSVLEERLAAVLYNSAKALKEIFKIENPKIAVAGLNPHAGENGIIGLEEKAFMEARISEFRALNPDVYIQGPLSADSMFALAAQQYQKGIDLDFDLYVAAYHDQVLPLVKGLGGLQAINLTVGLPYLRLSVDHGTGFDIVGKGLASPEAFQSCLNFCKNAENLLFSN
jgi:4-hydroxythreonine-4-phosphate dehydrogenase